MGVDLLLHHRHHVEGVSHGVEAQDARQLLEASSVEYFVISLLMESEKNDLSRRCER